jgi:hypothetical protein
LNIDTTETRTNRPIASPIRLRIAIEVQVDLLDAPERVGVLPRAVESRGDVVGLRNDSSAQEDDREQQERRDQDHSTRDHPADVPPGGQRERHT